MAKDDTVQQRSKTKEEQQKKKNEFNKSRVKWFTQYMNGELPELAQMSFSRDRTVVLTQNEQFTLARLIQSGITGQMLLSEIAQRQGDKPVHINKTILPDKKQLLTYASNCGWTIDYFLKDKEALRRLKHIVHSAEKARNIFAEKNLGLVTMIAGRRKKNINAGAVDFDDLVAEGMTGLMIAIDRFNPDYGFAFSTPAAWWIDQPIRNYLDAKTKMIHMPTHMNNIYKAIYYAQKELRTIYSDDSQITDEKIVEYCQSVGHDITLEKIQQARQYRKECISLDTPLDGNATESKTLAELIEGDDEFENQVVATVDNNRNFDRMLTLVSDDKKREILRDWYMMNSQDAVNLSNISRKHCLTKERVRQLKTEAEQEIREKATRIAKEQGISLYEVLSM